jgi:D,D-heptose 1,7-bisphosphate phosphatase
VNAGLHILSRKLLEESRPSGEKVDLDRDILKPLIPSGRIFAYSTPEYIKDMGTPDRYRETGLDIERGLVAARNLSRPQRAVFLDRDGTINRLDGFITRPEDLVLIDGAADAIRRINQAGWLAIVITNQPVIARGDLSVEGLERLHHKMETDLGAAGAYVEDIFYCPHHPDKGYPGERPEYKIDCDCRKPKPGLILRAAAKYHIDLARSYMAGDDPRDAEAAIAAGCRPVLLAQDQSGPLTIAGRETPVFPDLLSFVEERIH